MKFPQFREGLKEIRGIFQHFGQSFFITGDFEFKNLTYTYRKNESFYSDEDCNGSIDREELQKCLKKLHLDVTEGEIDDLFCACDIDENEGIQLKEFIVLLCLIYFLMDSSSASHDV